jgi:UDP-N-acetylglucosamine transferase subunit ALG13
MAGTRTVAVSVGTDHHVFDRLMDWIELWAATAPPDVRVIVQHGSSRPPSNTINHDILGKEEFEALLAGADVVVVQGGPGGIMDARRAGRLPIAVPRLHRLGEAVDDHQVDFCRRMSDAGKIVLATSAPELQTAVERQLADPSSARIVDDTAHVAVSVQRFGDLVDALLGRDRAPHGHLLRRGRGIRLRRRNGNQRSGGDRA